MSRPRQPPSAAGFTLVETLVALAVSLAIGALLYAIFLGGWRAWESTTRAAAWTARAPDLVQQLQADLAARHHLAGFIPEGDAAGFTLLRPARRPHPELIQVTYRWESAARRLRRTEQPWVWPAAAARPAPRHHHYSLAAFSASYAAPDPDGPLQWQTGWSDRTNYPPVIRLQLTPPGSTTPLKLQYLHPPL